MFNTPIFYATASGIPDIQIGLTNFFNSSALPVPLPPELEEEFTGTIQIRNVEIYKTQDFRVLTYAGQELMIVDPSGHTRVEGTFQITGNQIKSSTGATAITLSGPNVQLAGTAQIAGIISSPVGTNSFAGNVAVGGNIAIVGTISASVKFFEIPHPSPEKKGMRLRHSSLEGPENAVFYRGKIHGHRIPLPQYWKDLVDLNTLTAHLTPTSENQKLVMGAVHTGEVFVYNSTGGLFHYFIVGTRKDISQLEVEYGEE
jgi:hypothetical protein